MSIAENIARIREEICAAARNAGRDPKEILLCAATKMNGSEHVRQAIAAGVDCCGENRVQELTQKLAEGAYEGAPVHFIGHLQTNKVRQVVGKVSLIQSVDSLRLLEAIQKEACKQGIIQEILWRSTLVRRKANPALPTMRSRVFARKWGVIRTFVLKDLWQSPQFPKKVEKIANFFKKCSFLLLT